MNNKKMKFAQRVELNSKNYAPRALFELDTVAKMFEGMYKTFGVETLMTDRHGSVVMTNGNFNGFVPDVVNKPGNKIRVKGRTVCHVYVKCDNVKECDKDAANELIKAYIATLEKYSNKSYMASEQAVYIDELEQKLEKEAYQAKYADQNDPLTGVLNRNYFMSRTKQLTANEVVPTAAICININDWRYVDSKFGEEESDRMISTVAEIIESTAKECGYDDAVIGRVEGDVFNVLLPLIESDEANEFCQKVQEKCWNYDDEVFAISVAVGCVMKTNVEESFKDVLSDAEYEMFENKLKIKNSQGYREHLEKI